MSEFLYVPNGSNNTVSVIDTSNDTVVATIPVGGVSAAVSPNGAFVYVASESGIISVISTASNTVVDTITVASNADIIAFSPDGTKAYVTNISNAPSGIVWVIDTATDLVTTTINVGYAPYGITFSPDGTHAYVANEGGTVSVIDTTSNSVTATVTGLGNTSTMNAVSPDGTHLYVDNWGSGTTSVIDTATNSVVATINIGGNPYGVVISPDGTHAYVANYDGTVSVIDTTSNMVVDSFDAGGPAVGIAISHDGAHLYVTHYSSSSTVSVIDTSTDMVVDTINVGSVPEYPAILDKAPAVTASLVSDTGISTTDKITSNDALTGSGDPNALVHFTIDGKPILDTVKADASGVWSFTPTGLADGHHTIVASETDFAGNTGTASLAFTLDTTAPIDVIISDALNKNGSFTIAGTSEANSTIKVYDGSTLLGSTVPNSGGQWSFTTAPLSKTTVHSFNSTATDVAGNVGSSGLAVYGTKGNDTITGSAGNDLLTGGPGKDTFLFASSVIGKDVITDFTATGSSHDILQFDHSIFANAADVLAHATQVGNQCRYHP